MKGREFHWIANCKFVDSDQKCRAKDDPRRNPKERSGNGRNCPVQAADSSTSFVSSLATVLPVSYIFCTWGGLSSNVTEASVTSQLSFRRCCRWWVGWHHRLKDMEFKQAPRDGVKDRGKSNMLQSIQVPRVDMTGATEQVQGPAVLAPITVIAGPQSPVYQLLPN